MERAEQKVSDYLDSRMTTGTGLLAMKLTLVGVLFFFGLVLVLPGDTFNTGMGYRVFKSIASENTWGIFFIVASLFGFVTAFIKNLYLELIGAMLLATLHGMLGILTFLGNPSSTGTTTYLTLAGLGYYLLARNLRLWGEYRTGVSS